MSIQIARRNAALAVLAIVTSLGLCMPISSAQAQPVPPVPAPGAQSAGQTTTEFLIGSAVSEGTANSPQYADVTLAITRFGNNAPDEAEKLLGKALLSDPKLPPVEVMMGRLWALAGQPLAGRNELEKAIGKHPNDPDAYLFFAEAALVDRRTADADALLLQAKPLIEKFADNARRKHHFNVRLNSALAAVAELREKWPDAEKNLAELLKLDPENVQGHQRMARALFKRSDYKKAYESAAKAKSIDDKATNPAIMMAYFQEEAKNHKEAMTMLNWAVKNFPKDLNVMLAAARLALATSELTDAKTFADTALRIDQNSVDAKVLRGQVARFSNDLPTAEKMLESATIAAPANIDASNQLALTLLDQNDSAKAERALQFATMNARATTQGNRVNPVVLSTLAYALYKNKRMDQAEQILAQLLNAGPVNQDTAFYVAQILRDRGQLDNAIRFLEAAINNPTPFVQRDATTKLLGDIKEEQKKNDKGDGKSGEKGKDSTPASKSK